MALDWTELPIQTAAIEVNTAKRLAAHLQFKPRLSTYIGPPSILPLGVVTLYFTDSNASEYFVDIPNTPVSQHQSTAPGPPIETAVATPIILPVPIVAAKAVAKAEN